LDIGDECRASIGNPTDGERRSAKPDDWAAQNLSSRGIGGRFLAP